MECGTPAWNAIAAYAGVWMATFVIGFPLFVMGTLWSYRNNSHVPNAEMKLGFLMQDYKSGVPYLLWEGVEMPRKVSTVNSIVTVESTNVRRCRKPFLK
jgi:hypothetical protein